MEASGIGSSEEFLFFCDIRYTGFIQNLIDGPKLILQLPASAEVDRQVLVIIRHLHAVVYLQLMPNSESSLNEFDLPKLVHGGLKVKIGTFWK